jgi:hypothetical protein
LLQCSQSFNQRVANAVSAQGIDWLAYRSNNQLRAELREGCQPGHCTQKHHFARWERLRTRLSGTVMPPFSAGIFFFCFGIIHFGLSVIQLGAYQSDDA